MRRWDHRSEAESATELYLREHEVRWTRENQKWLSSDTSWPKRDGIR